LGEENMGLKRLLLLLMSVLFAGLFCISCSGKEHETAPLKINPGKDIHSLYEKVVKEKEKSAKNTKQNLKATEPKRANQTPAGD
jgi:hypothetical protein